MAISLSKAAKVACVAAAVGPTAPATFSAALGAAALGLIGCLGIDAIASFSDKVKRGLSLRGYRVAPLSTFDAQVDVESLRRAMARVKAEYGSCYDKFLKAKKLSSEEDALKFFQKEFQEGTCQGQVSTLLSIAKQTNSSFNKETLSQMKNEEVFYRQILGIIANTGFEVLTLGELMNLKAADKLFSMPSTSKFAPKVSSASYLRLFEKEIGAGKRSQGCIQLPNHVFAFQWSPEGCFIYDSIARFAGGLLKFPNERTFFQELRNQILFDLQGNVDEEIRIQH